MTSDLRHKVYELLRAYALPKLRYDNDLMNVLSSIWDVYRQKATGEDFRYKVLGDEIEKHYIMNDDWADDKLFIGILHLMDDEGKFVKFTEQIVLMAQGEDGFDGFKTELIKTLNTENLTLYEEQEANSKVFRIRKVGSEQIVFNDGLKFHVCESNVYNAVHFYENDVKWPEDKHCFVLTYDGGWNDYSYYTRYRLYYVKDGSASTVGEVKIMKRGAAKTAEHLPKDFIALGAEFCSLGCSTSYYRNMRALLGEKAHEVLSQLRDTAFYEYIYKMFENDDIYKTSLLRNNESERARREGRYCVYGRDMEDAYAFTYRYELPYQGDDVEIDFNYKYNGNDYERIIGLIGENGVGKTTLIKKMLHSLVMNDNKNFTGLRPLFSSVLMISYSPFDHYQVDTQGQPKFINYEYSGLMKGKEEMYSTNEQVGILAQNIKEIYRRKNFFYFRWEMLVNKVIPKERFGGIVEVVDANEVSVDERKLLELCKRASSGETMYLYSISAIMAKIRMDSLIIMDEPEQHLHPRAVTALMHSVYWILEKYESFALISTHSPYVIRELVSPNVRIFTRYAGGLSVKRIGIESFGEDVSVLSDTVFGNMSEEKRYERFIENVVKANNYDYEASVRALQTGPNALGLNARLVVRTIIDKRQG